MWCIQKLLCDLTNNFSKLISWGKNSCDTSMKFIRIYARNPVTNVPPPICNHGHKPLLYLNLTTLFVVLSVTIIPRSEMLWCPVIAYC